MRHSTAQLRRHQLLVIESVHLHLQVEDKEIEARKNNLVLYNIPENQSERYETRVQADKDFIVKMCDDVAGVQITDSDVLKAFALVQLWPIKSDLFW